MRKTTNNIKRRNNYILLTIMTFMVSLMLVGCGSNATTETVKSEPEAVVKEEAPKVEEVETKVPEEAAVEEPVVEETVVEETVVEEPEKELYIPEGIDMASTLPGEEWLDTFVGNVNEPVAVVFNDNTGRKEVIQGKSEVLINPEEDRLAIFLNEENMSHMLYKIFPKDLIDGENYTVYILDPEKQRETEAGFTIYSGDEECGFIEFTIILE